jgi:cytoskeletal protein CcmA (bactofilin family)
MFNKEDKRAAEIESTTSNIISRGTILEGNIKTPGNLRIEGRVIGNLITKSKAALAQSSYVDGNILAKNAEVAGEVKGQVEVSEMLILKPTCIIHGDIVTNKLIVESGATFNGGCKMGVHIDEIHISLTKTSNKREKSVPMKGLQNVQGTQPQQDYKPA